MYILGLYILSIIYFLARIYHRFLNDMFWNYLFCRRPNAFPSRFLMFFILFSNKRNVLGVSHVSYAFWLRLQLQHTNPGSIPEREQVLNKLLIMNVNYIWWLFIYQYWCFSFCVLLSCGMLFYHIVSNQILIIQP